jgi:hypothetical protein
VGQLHDRTAVPSDAVFTVRTYAASSIADDRADAIRLVLARFRQQPEYEQLRERVRETGRLRAGC